MIRWLILCLLLAAPVRAEQIVSGLSESRVSINASFDGTAILIYGAAMRDAPPPSWPLLQVIVTVEGPVVPIVVRHKARVAGIWINQGAMAIEGAPSFYSVMSTGPLADILSPEEDRLHRVSIPMEIGTVRMKAGAGATSDYLAAFARIKEASGTYLLAPDSVLLLQQSLFRTEVTLPANLVEGEYRVRIFLTRGGKVVDLQESQIEVSKAGVERLLFRMAQDQPLLYGLVALLIAAVAGWGASELFRRMRW
ncbi:MAG: TIGR02186 family protein [Pseudorhodobacter sp.]|nr:TIGR02186 family protein [Pseudorhodobacter sp.]